MDKAIARRRISHGGAIAFNVGTAILLLVFFAVAYQLFYALYFAMAAIAFFFAVVMTIGLILVSADFRNLFNSVFSADTSHVNAVGETLHKYSTLLFSFALVLFVLSLFLYIFGDRRTSRTVKIVFSSIFILISIIGLFLSVASGGTL